MEEGGGPTMEGTRVGDKEMQKEGARGWNGGGGADEERGGGRKGLDMEGEKSKCEKTKICRVIFAKNCHRGATWHATSDLEACVACLGP